MAPVCPQALPAELLKNHSALHVRPVRACADPTHEPLAQHSTSSRLLLDAGSLSGVHFGSLVVHLLANTLFLSCLDSYLKQYAASEQLS